MARPREFDTDEALAKAMQVFWKLGYADATLPDLLAGMEITRGSLYKAFTDKKTLFLQVLEKYDDQIVSDAVAMLTDPDKDGWTRIFALFDAVADAMRSGDRRGCLLCSAIAGPAAIDQDIEAFATKSLNRLQAAFKQALEPVVPQDISVALADMLVVQYVGIRVMARTKGTGPKIEHSITALKDMAARFDWRA